MRARYLLALLPIGACVPTVDDFAADCRAYGFEPATLEMAQCVQASRQAWDANFQNGMAAMNANFQAQQQNQLYEQQLQQQRSQAGIDAIRATAVQRVRVVP